MNTPAPTSGSSTARAANGTIGPYQLVSHLGSGGMASVYLAEKAGAAGFVKPVVLKTIRAGLREDPEMLEMFLDEGRLMSRLSHPNVPQIFELGEDDGRFYIAMEYVRGESVAAVLRKSATDQRRVPLLFAIHIAVQLLDALEYLHRLTRFTGEPLNLIHRDVTPTNVVVTFEGAVKLLDFGIARSSEQTSQTAHGIRKGKLAFMAPEQWKGEPLDQRVDIFAAAAILYELIVGSPALAPHDGYSLSDVVSGALVQPARELRPDVPAALEEILKKALSPNREDRYASAADFNEAVGQFAATLGMTPGQRELREYMKILFPAKEAAAQLPQPPPLPQGSIMELGQSAIISEQDADSYESHLISSRLRGKAAGKAVVRVSAALVLLAGVGTAGMFFRHGPAAKLATAPVVTARPASAPLAASIAPKLAAPVVVSAAPKPELKNETPAAIVAAAPKVPAKPEPTADPQPTAKAELANAFTRVKRAPRPGFRSLEQSQPKLAQASISGASSLGSPQGRVRLTAATPTPVFEGDRQLGMTPLTIDLPAGKHHVWMLKAGVRMPVLLNVEANTQVEMFINNATTAASGTTGERASR